MWGQSVGLHRRQSGSQEGFPREGIFEQIPEQMLTFIPLRWTVECVSLAFLFARPYFLVFLP